MVKEQRWLDSGRILNTSNDYSMIDREGRCLLSGFLVIRGIISVIVGAAAVDNGLLKVLLLLLSEIVCVLEACSVLIIIVLFFVSERIVVILSSDIVVVVFACARRLLDAGCLERSFLLLLLRRRLNRAGGAVDVVVELLGQLFFLPIERERRKEGVRNRFGIWCLLFTLTRVITYIRSLFICLFSLRL